MLAATVTLEQHLGGTGLLRGRGEVKEARKPLASRRDFRGGPRDSVQLRFNLRSLRSRVVRSRSSAPNYDNHDDKLSNYRVCILFGLGPRRSVAFRPRPRRIGSALPRGSASRVRRDFCGPGRVRNNRARPFRTQSDRVLSRGLLFRYFRTIPGLGAGAPANREGHSWPACKFAAPCKSACNSGQGRECESTAKEKEKEELRPT